MHAGDPVLKVVGSYRSVISLEGIIGSGKSTLLRSIQTSGLPMFANTVFVSEDVASWKNVETASGPVDLFKLFYQKPKQYGYQFQSQVLLSLAKRESQCVLDIFHPMIMERSMESCLNVFASLLHDEKCMSDTEFAIFKSTVEFLRDIVPQKPKCFVFVDTPVDVAYDRMRSRGRDGEDGVPMSYLKKLHAKHYDWFNNPGFGHEHKVYLNGDAEPEVVFEEFMNSGFVEDSLRSPTFG